MKSEIAIRPMAASDLDSVLALAENLPQAPHWARSAWETAVNQESMPHRVALVAEGPESGAVRGFAVASLLPPRAELESIAVAPEDQRLGLGRQLFLALSAELQAARVNELDLEVRASNQPARAFYRHLGFLETGSRPGYYTDPIEDALLMSLPLTATPQPPAADPS